VPTIDDVARRAGVSRATVSRYLNGHRVRSRAAIESAIAEIGFSLNQTARSLKSGSTRSIGVVVPDITNPFFAHAVRGIEVSSRDDEYNIFLCNTDESAARQDEVLDNLVGRVDAVILAPATESATVPSALRLMGVPVVLLDREFGDHSLFDSVLVDNEGGAGAAARYLAQLGHRRIGLISGPLSATPGRTRHEGFLQALASEGITLPPECVAVGDFREQSGYIAAKSFLGLAEPPTAIFGSNNLMAIGALKALRESRLRVPDDVSFISFDELDVGELLEPRLTTVTRPTTEQGALAATLLAERLRGEGPPSPRRCVLETRLSVRDSCAPPLTDQVREAVCVS
jgi:DNA-binding LacI/PurR family transcriptional regulator